MNTQQAEATKKGCPVSRALTGPEMISCSCLLAPKCFHLLAVASVLELLEEMLSEPDEVEPERALDLAPEQIEAAKATWRAGALLLAAGASGAGAVLQAELLRAVHECRATGLHRAAAAGLRIVRAVRDLRDERPEFALGAFAEQLMDMLATSRALADGMSDPAMLGAARRAYASLGNLKLSGLFTEPIVAATGYAGVVTYLVDAGGTI